MKQCLEYKVLKLTGIPLTVIHLEGEVEDNIASIVEIATAPETEHVAIIMEDVKYINSCGCGVLLALQTRVKNRGFRMYVVGPVGGVEAVMLHLGCHLFMRMKKSLEEVILDIKTIPE